MLLDLMLRGADDTATAAQLGSTPALCRLGLDILSWQKLKTRLPSLLPLGTKVAHKTGTGSRGYMDAGIVYKEGRPLFILTAYTDGVPAALPDGMPGFADAAQCATCHGPDARGADLGTCLVEKEVLLRPADYDEVVRKGRRRMPGFAAANQVIGRMARLAWDELGG